MKNIYSYIAFFAAAAIALTGCSKNADIDDTLPEGKKFTIDILASTQNAEVATDVRTAYDPIIGDIKWTGTEEMQLYVNLVDRKPTAELQADGKAKFSADLRSIIEPTTITLQGVIPSSSILGIKTKDNEAKKVTALQMLLPSEQNGGTIATFDPAADILIAKDLAVEITNADITAGTKSIDNFQFGRPMAISKYTMEVTNAAVSADELVESVQWTVTSGPTHKKYLTGRFYFNPNIGKFVDNNSNPIDIDAPFYSGQGFDYVKTTYAAQPTLGTLVFWAVTAPVKLVAGDALVFTITTDKNTIVKTITLTQPMTFTNRSLNTANVAINDKNCVVTPIAPPAQGETVILTTAEIKAGLAHGSYVQFTLASASGTWGGLAIVNTATGFLQINSPNTSSRKGCSILSPAFEGEVKSITIKTTSSTSNDRKFYIFPGDYDPDYNSTTDDPSNAIAQGATTSSGGSVTISTASTAVNQFKIFADGTAYISSIEVTYIIDLTPRIKVADADKTFNLTYNNVAEHSFGYSVANLQLSDVTVAQDAASEDWLIFDVSKAGSVGFTAPDANTGAARTATITLSAPGAASVTITVAQAKAPEKLADITGLTATANGAKVTASWIPNANASNYAWRIATGGKDVQTGTATTGSAVISGLAPNTAYVLYVKAVGDNINYANSDEVSTNVTTEAVPMLSMSEVTIKADDTTAASLTAQWTAVANAAGYMYKVVKKSDNSVVVAETVLTAGTTSIAIAKLDPETVYTISVKATGDGAAYADSEYKSVDGTTGVKETGTQGTYTSNVTLSSSGGSTAASQQLSISGKNYSGIKLGSGSAGGSFLIKSLPVTGNVTMNFYALGWKGDTGTQLKVSVDNVEASTFTLTENSGATGTGTFTIATIDDNTDYFSVSLTGITSASVVKIESLNKKRAVVFGVNAQ